MHAFDPAKPLPVENYLIDFERVTLLHAVATGSRWTAETLGGFLYAKLEGGAAQWAQSCAPRWESKEYLYRALKRNLLEQYSMAFLETTDDVKKAMGAMTKSKTQTWIDYAQAIVTAAKGHAISDAWMVMCFQDGLPMQYAVMSRHEHPRNVNQCALSLQRVSRHDGTGVGGPDIRPLKTLSAVTSLDESVMADADGTTITALRTMTASLDALTQGIAADRGSRAGGRGGASRGFGGGRGRGSDSRSRTCWQCNSPDHFRRNCPEWMPENMGSDGGNVPKKQKN
jgi:hypothetical protein